MEQNKINTVSSDIVKIIYYTAETTMPCMRGALSVKSYIPHTLLSRKYGIHTSLFTRLVCTFV